MRRPRLHDEAPFEQDPGSFLDPTDDSDLLAYFEDLAKWHGYVRFLGLPHLRESPDQPLWELYVEPYLAERPVPVDEDPEKWGDEVQPALTTVLASPRLLVLGDPGSGKSTLVSWIAWQLGCPPSTRWRELLGPLVPLPMVLREMKIGPKLGWDSLLAAFLAHPVAERLRGEGKVEDLLERGQAFPLLDGLDEIGNLEVRRAVRAAVFEGSARYPSCRFLVTSRIVGYEATPFEECVGPILFDGTAPEWTGFAPASRPAQGGVLTWGDLRYVAPFTDEQIARFAHNWYARREAADARRERGAADLIQAVRGTPSTLRLARNPNLLTLMALVHRVQARLPHGRVLLFEKIAEAYLESIDTFRGLAEVDYPLAQKKRWLAYVGFQMQLRRAEAEASEEGEEKEKASGREKSPREVLADHETVVEWIADAMAASSRGADPTAARAFVEYIGRRSGLLLPRGEGLYAFTHLSFQEYFAALYLADQVVSPRWLSGQGPAGTRPDDLRRHAGRVTWRETLVLLFELLAERPDWTEILAEQVFGEGFRAVEESKERDRIERGELLAQVTIDPHVGFSADQRAAALEACWQCELGGMAVEQGRIARALGRAEESDLAAVWAALQRAAALRPRFLTLSQTPFSEASLLSGFTDLRGLSLSFTRVMDLSGLSTLTQLESLTLNGTGVTDLSALSGLSGLDLLHLSNTRVTDLRPLAGLTKLRFLNLNSTPVADLTVLAHLTSLLWLNLSHTGIADLSALSGLADLQFLILDSTEVSDVAPLAQLRSLRRLELAETLVADVSPLTGLTELEVLDLTGTEAHGVTALQKALPGLRIIR